MLIFVIIKIAIIITRVQSEYARAVGKILCDNEAIKYARIKLMDSDPISDEEFGESITGYDGSFDVSGYASDTLGGSPDPYIRVEYYYKGRYGEFIIQSGFWQIDCKDQTSIISYSSYMNFGTINFSNEQCRTYKRIYNAFEDFYNRAYVPVPVYVDIIINSAMADMFCGSNACTMTETIRITSDYEISDTTAKHELAHVIRAQYDGDLFHYLYDSLTYSYGGAHGCGSKTNYGYAFYEGWSEYWAYSCQGYNGTDYTIEGNVAGGLRNLQSKCKTSYYQMVRVLKLYPGAIHSFQDFNNKHYNLYTCKL